MRFAGREALSLVGWSQLLLRCCSTMARKYVLREWSRHITMFIKQNPNADGRRQYLVMTQCAHVCQRGVRFGDYFYIRTYHSGYHLFPKEMLFNIREDPHEQHDLAMDRPELCARACRYLADWQEEMMLTSEDDRDPLWTTLIEGGPLHGRCNTQEYYQRLLETGRVEGARVFKERFGYEFGKMPREFRMTL